MRCRATATCGEALELINAAERPLILAGHGIMLSGAEREILALAERAQIPIAMTLLGIGGVPASHPLNLGMMGMHGEAWVNTAIQEADLLIALGMRFDDRVTGNLKTYAPQREEDPRRHRSRRAQQERPRRRRRSPATCARRSPSGCRTSTPAIARAWLAHIDELKGDSAVRDIQNLPDDGHLYAAHVINDLWRLTDGNARRRHRRRPAPDVGSAVLQARHAALAHHLGRPRHDGLRAAGGDRRQDRVPGRRSLGGRRRRRLPDDAVRAGDGRAGGPRRQHRDHQQRLPRDGAAVAGVLLREALRRDADHAARTS